MYTVNKLKENLQSVLNRLEELPGDTQIAYCTPDMGGYTDGFELKRFKLSIIKEEDVCMAELHVLMLQK